MLSHILKVIIDVNKFFNCSMNSLKNIDNLRRFLLDFLLGNHNIIFPRFLLEVSEIKYFKEKAKCLMFRTQLNEGLSTLYQNITTLHTAFEVSLSHS